MATITYDSFKDLRKGKYDWKVPARVMNIWRGYTRKGEPFKGFNLLLLDSKRCRVHAFVPGNIADVLEPTIEIGNIYLFKNFTVKDYKPEDKFRCVMKDIHIVFSKDTKICEFDENEVCIEKAVFDFYDIGDLKDLSQQSTYLTDVIGVIQDAELRLARFTNKLGQPQTQIKFHITDGNSYARVTFWDAYAEMFDDLLKDELEYPIIIIISSGRITEWQGEVDISNVGPTSIFLNINHHSVIQMREMLKLPQFADMRNVKRNNEPLKILTVKEIKELGEDHIGKKVYCELNVKNVNVSERWFRNICTSCYLPTTLKDEIHYCSTCTREVPCPLKWFELSVQTCDDTGELDVILENAAGQNCYTKDVFDFVDLNNEKLFPSSLKSIESNTYMMRLVIKNENIRFKSGVYFVEDVVNDYSVAATEQRQPKPLQESFVEASSSSIHVESLSENS